MPIAQSTHVAPRRLARAAGVAAAALATTAAGCGASGDENADPARIAPAATVVYLEAMVRPQGDQAEAAEDIGRRVFRVSDPAGRLQQLVDHALQRNRATRNVSYGDDVEPWLGRRAALVLIPPAADRGTAAIFAVKDTGAAGKLVDRVAADASPRWPRRYYRGVGYRFDPGDGSAQGVVGDYLVAGDQGAFKAVVDAFQSGRGLAGAPAYRRVAGDARGKLGFAYVDVDRAVSPLGTGTALLRSLVAGTAAAGPVTVSLAADADRVMVDTVVRGRGSIRPVGRAAQLVARLPADAWLALGVASVGRALGALAAPGDARDAALAAAVRRAVRVRSGLDLVRDVIPALGDVGLFARGSSPSTVGAGVVVAARDPATARRLVAGLRRLVGRAAAGAGVRTGDASIAGAHGFKVASPRLPGIAYVVVRGDRMVAAYGGAATREALRARSLLAATPPYRAARASLAGAPPAMLVDFAPVAALLAAASGPGGQRASAYLSGLGTLALGWRTRDDRRVGRIVVTLR
jgi:uncharacterized protein DUF3352